MIDLADGSRIQLNPDSGVVLDEDVIDAQLLASIAPGAGEQSAGGFAVTSMDNQEQVAAADQQNETGRTTGLDAITTNAMPAEFAMRGNDLSGSDAPDANPQPPENPVGKIPTLSVADIVITEPPTAGSQGAAGGGGHESGEEGGEEHTDSGNDSGSDTHDSGGGHDTVTGDESGSDAGGHGAQAPVHAVFTVVLSAPALTNVMVDFSTANGTAIAGGRGVDENDFGQTQGTLTIPRGEISGTIEIEIPWAIAASNRITNISTSI